MAKYCKAYNLRVTYIDCMDCETKECRGGNKPPLFHREDNKMKHLIKTKLELGQEVYYVLIQDKQKHVVKANVNQIMIGTTGITYIISDGIILAPKQHKGKKASACHIKEENVDTGYQGFAQCWATFTTKEKCKEYLKNV